MYSITYSCGTVVRIVNQEFFIIDDNNGVTFEVIVS